MFWLVTAYRTFNNTAAPDEAVVVKNGADIQKVLAGFAGKGYTRALKKMITDGIPCSIPAAPDKPKIKSK